MISMIMMKGCEEGKRNSKERQERKRSKMIGRAVTKEEIVIKRVNNAHLMQRRMSEKHTLKSSRLILFSLRLTKE